MIRSKNIFLPVSPSPPNHITQQGFLAKLCPIFALSAITCPVNTTVVSLNALVYRPSYAIFDGHLMPKVTGKSVNSS